MADFVKCLKKKSGGGRTKLSSESVMQWKVEANPLFLTVKLIYLIFTMVAYKSCIDKSFTKSSVSTDFLKAGV